MTIGRIDDVTFDYPSSDARAPLGDLLVWKVKYGFECVVSIAHRLFHGVSVDGKWFIIERYPLDQPFELPELPEISEGMRAAVSRYGEASCAMQWGAHVYVYVHGPDGYRRVALSEDGVERPLHL